MALLEINLEKPALVEEYQYPGETPVGEGKKSESESSGGGKGKLVVLLAVLATVGLAAWKAKQKLGGSEEPASEEYEHGPEPEIGAEESGGNKRKVAGVLGLALAVVSLAAAKKVRK